MRKYTLAFLALFLLVSCGREHLVEIYLLKQRKSNKEGVEIKKLGDYGKKNGYTFDELSSYTTVDTINKKILFASNFDYSKVDLQDKPFIKDDEILRLNISSNLIEFNNSGGKKILGLKPHMGNGEQFVITVDKEPVMNGYFYSPYSSNGSTWYTIQYDDFKSVADSSLKSYKFTFFKGDGTSNRLNRKPIEFKDFPTLLEALQKTGRITK